MKERDRATGGAVLLASMIASAAVPAGAVDHPGDRRIDLTRDWRYARGDVANAASPDLDDSGWLTTDVALSRKYRESHPRLPGEVVWYRYALRLTARDLAGEQSWVAVFERPEAIRSVHLNGTELSVAGRGHGGQKWGYYFAPPGALMAGRNVLAVAAYDLKMLVPNHFGRVEFRLAALEDRLKAGGGSRVLKDGRAQSVVKLKNVSRIGVNVTVSGRVEDLFGRVLREVGTRTASLEANQTGWHEIAFDNRAADHKLVLTVASGDERLAPLWVYALPIKRELSEGHRREIVLDTPTYGWEYVRLDDFDEFTPPAPRAGWKEAKVPCNKWNPPFRLDSEHPRAWMRVRFTVPKDMRGQSYNLHFGSVGNRPRVFLNGKLLLAREGGADFPSNVPADEAIREDGENELLVGVYGEQACWKPELTEGGGWRKGRPSRALIWGEGEPAGLLRSVRLQSFPRVSVRDVKVLPWVTRGTVEIVCRLVNRSRRGVRVGLSHEALFQGRPEAKLGRTAESVPAGGEKTVSLEARWKPEHLWTPATPGLYQLVSRVESEGSVLDRLDTRFGAREFGIRGDQLTLNGHDFRVRGSYWFGGGPMSRHGTNWFYSSMKTMKRENYNGYRCFVGAKECLNVMDELGMIGSQEIHLGACHANKYDGDDQRFYDNLVTLFAALIDDRFNHPAVIAWNSGNEYVAKNLVPGKRLGEAHRGIEKLDPTRFVVNDHGSDLGGTARLPNTHYPATRLLPNDAAFYGTPVDNMPEIERRRWEATYLKDPQEQDFRYSVMDTSKPVWIGEYSWLHERACPGDKTGLSGEEGCVFWPVPHYARYAGFSLGGILSLAHEREMFYRTYRQNRIAAFQAHGWHQVYYRNLAPRAVLAREWDRAFFGGRTVERTLTVHNDISVPAELRLRWELTDGTRFIARGEKAYRLGPYEIAEETLRLPLPRVDRARYARLKLALSDGTRTAYEDELEYAVHPEVSLRAPRGLRVAVYDPPGRTREVLGRLGLAFRACEDPGTLEDIDLLIVGRDAMDATARGAAGSLRRFIQRGGKVLQLRQEEAAGLMPVALEQKRYGYMARAFGVAPGHPVLRGVLAEDLDGWAPDRLVATDVWGLPGKGNCRALAVGGDRLVATALVEMPVDRGWFIASQMEIVPCIERAPGARLLLQNILDYAAAEAFVPLEGTAILLDAGLGAGATRVGDSLEFRHEGYTVRFEPSLAIASLYVGSKQIIKDSGYWYRQYHDTGEGRHGISFGGRQKNQNLKPNVTTEPGQTVLTVTNRDAAKRPDIAFTEKVTLLPEGLDLEFEVEITGRPKYPHAGVFVPFQFGPVNAKIEGSHVQRKTSLGAETSAGTVTFGVTGDAGLAPTADRRSIRAHVSPPFDLGRKKRFAVRVRLPGASGGGAREAERFLTNQVGLVAEPFTPGGFAEYRTLITKGLAGGVGRSLVRQRRELLGWLRGGGRLVVSGLTKADLPILQNILGYELELRRRSATCLAKTSNDPLLSGITNHHFNWGQMKNLVDFSKVKEHPLDIVREEIAVKRPADRAEALTFPAALVKIREGKGFVLLDQVRWAEAPFPKAEKLVSGILTNLGARCAVREAKERDFGDELRGRTPHFVDLRRFSNWAFAEDERGRWRGAPGLGVTRDLRNFPVGRQTFKGVPFDVIVPETNKMRSCIVLWGPREGGGLPKAVRDIPVGRKFERLFFLHTCAWLAKTGFGTPVLRYRVKYDENWIPGMEKPETVVEIKRDRDIHDWWFPEKVLLGEGILAWKGPVAEGRHVGVYMYEWTNPKPESVIKAIDIETAGSAVPVVIGVTGIE